MNFTDNRISFLNKLPHLDRILLITMSIIGGLVIIVATRPYGVGISPDSVVYISVSRNIINGYGFLDYNMNPLVSYAPMYPILVSLFSILVDKDPIKTIPFINAILFASTIYLSGIFLKKTFHNSTGYLLGLIPLLVSSSYLQVFTMAWTEPLFIVLTISYFITLQKNYDKNRPSSLIWLSIIISLACLTRYVGITLLLNTIFYQMFLINKPLSDKIKQVIILSILPGLSLAGWLMRNYLLSGSMTGTRLKTEFSMVDNLNSAIDTVLSWFLPERVTESRYIYMFLFLLLLGNLFLVLRNPSLLRIFHKSLFNPMVVFILFYIGFLLLTSQTSFWQLIDNRYLTPIFLPVITIFLTYIFVLYAFFVKKVKIQLLSIPTFFVLLWLGYCVSTSIGIIKTQYFEGSGYSSKVWQSSQVINYISTNLQDRELYSNGMEVIYLLNGRQSKSLPLRQSIGEFNTEVKKQKVCLLWFDNITWRDYLYSPEELLSEITDYQSVKLNDGTIYYVTYE